MGKHIEPRKKVLRLVDDDVLEQEEAKDILGVTQGRVAQYMDDGEGSKEWEDYIKMDREATLKLADGGILTQKQAGNILGIGQPAVALALDN